MKIAVEETNKPIFVGVNSIVIGGLYFLLTTPFAVYYIVKGGIEYVLSNYMLIDIAILVVEVFVIVSGICALKRKMWILALIGSIISLFGFLPTSVFALILIVRSRYEFDKMNRNYVTFMPYSK